MASAIAVNPSTSSSSRYGSSLASEVTFDANTGKDLGSWSVVSAVEKHYTGDVPEAPRQAMGWAV